MRKTVTDYVKILAGVTLMAVGITVFFEPHNIVTGGVTGLSIVLASFAGGVLPFDIPLSVFNMALNIPLLIIGYRTLGKDFIWRTVIATFSYSAALELASYLPAYDGDFVIVSVFGGVLMGAGVGLAISGYATTGGSDLLASIIHSGYKSISVANAIFVIDSAVIATGFVVFGVEPGLYAIISVFISAKVIDAILEGLSFSKGAFIISDKSTEIAADVMRVMQRGVTGLDGRGMYTDSSVNVLLCVVAKKEIARLKHIVKSRDPQAFMVITDVREALGEGFGEH